ncbi:uncharacterized protein TNCT_91671 [Trichonephila clavata]|uniref:Uncharacterized protein n=1 Tax=Trichonephila clavata TaxID=2740835 RepID=A0A8X6H7U7_TRICU|nr:uncharacterized protein TNCT_91671 [Trichonephila clavata]
MNDLVCDSEKLVLCGGMQAEAVLDIRDDMVPITVINDARDYSLRKTKSITFWTKIDSKRPLNSPILLQNVIYETLQEARGGKARLECVRSSKRRIKSVKRKGMDRRKRQKRICQTPKIPNANSTAEENKCAVSKDTFWVWELFATDLYRRPTSNNAKSPYYFSYAFHHDGVVMAKFSAEDKDKTPPPEIIRKLKDFDIENGHFDFKFHPYIVNQYVYSMFNESDGTLTPPIIWKSNQYTLTTDDAGIGILCLKQYMTVAIHFFSKGTGENFGF